MRQLVFIKNVQHMQGKLITRLLEYLFILTENPEVLPDLPLVFTEIKTLQQTDHHNVMEMLIIHWLTTVTSFSSTVTTDLLSMQVCYICEP
jgi:hypothetical protein